MKDILVYVSFLYLSFCLTGNPLLRLNVIRFEASKVKSE